MTDWIEDHHPRPLVSHGRVTTTVHFTRTWFGGAVGDSVLCAGYRAEPIQGHVLFFWVAGTLGDAVQPDPLLGPAEVQDFLEQIESPPKERYALLIPFERTPWQRCVSYPPPATTFSDEPFE